MSRNTSSLKASLMLLLAATIWGVAFVAQSVGMEYIEPFTFSCIRSILGFLVLLPFYLFERKKSRVTSREVTFPKASGKILFGGILCGIFLSAATITQQIGIKYTTVGKAAFITTMYIVLVPVLGIFLGKKGTRFLWIAVGLAVVGLYLLCMNEEFVLAPADIIIIISAFCFALQILSVDRFSPFFSSIQLSCIQFFVCFIVSFVLMILFEKPQISQILAAWLPLLYTGVMSSGVAYTLQIAGQKGLNPTVASLIMSLESSISALAGWLILHQKLSGKELLGCAVMFLAIILAQLPEPKRKHAKY